MRELMENNDQIDKNLAYKLSKQVSDRQYFGNLEEKLGEIVVVAGKGEGEGEGGEFGIFMDKNYSCLTLD